MPLTFFFILYENDNSGIVEICNFFKIQKKIIDDAFCFEEIIQKLFYMGCHHRVRSDFKKIKVDSLSQQ